ncbi:alpha/beta hydrolase family protein [Psychroserpens luteus]|uniref:Alpha/beta hydrolase family protein n=1 Tax=Psychroserpens luteus TaxID=1434066 RepID=A0ABW5ZRU2_9FLAO|nr:prolyl oligopeptidase family serine peptidase [Psychroserpens luteus]
MLQKKYILLLIVTLSVASLFGQNTKILSREPLNIFKNEELANRISVLKNDKRVLKPNFRYLDSVKIEQITYLSDGLKVKGYLSTPLFGVKHPSVIYNRGGNGEFGSLNEFKAVFILAKVASWGYVVVGSQYRGNVGSEGVEEFGGEDVNDVLNLIPVLKELEKADTSRMALYGWSRGGMMTYLTLTKSCEFKAAIVGGGLSDLWKWMETRNDTIETVYAKNIPNYAINTKEALNARSAIQQVDKMCKTTPVLMLHGTNDLSVVPEMALDLSYEFLKKKIPHQLILFKDGNHGLSEHRTEVNYQTKQWLDTYLKY